MIDTREALAAKAQREVMSCIGCHDCMLACPIPEARSVTIAELNHAIHLPVISEPALVSFLSACTQCRQCVPACPADLSRADMVLFNKMKVEDSVPDQPLHMQQGMDAVPSGYMLDGLAQQLTAVRLFSGVAPGDLRRLLLKATLRQLAPGEALCREGDFHERLYVVLQGALEQASRGPRGESIRILVLSPGSFFGEMAIMADQPEAFDVTATELSAVVEIPKAAVHRLMSQSPSFQATMNELYSRRALWTYARKPSVLGGVSEQVAAELFEDADLKLVKAGHFVFKEGERPEDVYLVRSGFLKVSRAAPGSASGEVVLVYFREGDLFGLMPILFGEPGQAFTVSAASRAEVVRIRGSKLKQVLGKYPDARVALMARAIEAEKGARAAGPQAPMSAPAPGGPAQPKGDPMATMARPLSWDALVDQGVAQGREVLVIDQNRCTFCNNCVDACERRHDNSRLQLRGLQVENLMFPTACRHCEDPVCLLCSVNGIVRLPSGEITIVEENCIGCGACASRCPYGNISMHPVEKPKPTLLESFFHMLQVPGPPPAPKEHPSLWDKLMTFLKTQGSASATAAQHDTKVPKKAVKCDLCAGYDDYACVSACPVGAAFRIDPKALAGQDGAPLGLRAKRPS